MYEFPPFRCWWSIGEFRGHLMEVQYLMEISLVRCGFSAGSVMQLREVAVQCGNLRDIAGRCGKLRDCRKRRNCKGLQGFVGYCQCRRKHVFCMQSSFSQERGTRQRQVGNAALKTRSAIRRKSVNHRYIDMYTEFLARLGI